MQFGQLRNFHIIPQLIVVKNKFFQNFKTLEAFKRSENETKTSQLINQYKSSYNYLKKRIKELDRSSIIITSMLSQAYTVHKCTNHKLYYTWDFNIVQITFFKQIYIKSFTYF